MQDNYILIENAHVLPVRPAGVINHEQSIFIENKVIKAIGDLETIKREFPVGDSKKLSGKGRLVMPGMINGHTHLPEALERGICDDETLEKWLWDHVWVWEGRMTRNRRKDCILGFTENAMK